MYEIPVFRLGTLVASADLSGKQFYAVKQTSSGIAVAGSGENAIGILQNKPASGDVCEIECLGVSKAILGGTVTAGDNLMADSSGRLVAHTGTNAVVAVALASGAVGEVVPVLLVTRTGAGLSSTYSIVSFNLKLSKIADGDVITEFVPGFSGSIQKIFAVVTDPVTTSGKATTLNAEIGSTNLTGGVLALTSANCTPMGKVNNATAVTGNNSFSDTDSISIEASSTTAFAEGEISLCLVLKSN